MLNLQLLAGVPLQDRARHHDAPQALGPVTRVLHHFRVGALNSDADLLVMRHTKRNREIRGMFATAKMVLLNIRG